MTTAKTATRTVGISATIAKTLLKRMCKREPADFALLAANILITAYPTIEITTKDKFHQQEVLIVKYYLIYYQIDPVILKQ